MKNWEYCECGCHGYSWGNYWSFYDTRDNVLHLHRGHGWTAPKLGVYLSLEECTRAIQALEGHNEIEFELLSLEKDYTIPAEAMKRIRQMVDNLKEKAIASRN